MAQDEPASGETTTASTEATVTVDAPNGTIAVTSEAEVIAVPVTLRASLNSAAEVRTSIGELRAENGELVTVRLLRDGLPLSSTETIELAAGEAVTLRVVGQLPVIGTYSGTLQLAWRSPAAPGAEEPDWIESHVAISIERTSVPISVVVDDVGTVSATTAGTIAIPVRLRETSGQDRVVAVEDLVALTATKGTTTTTVAFRASFSDCSSTATTPGTVPGSLPASSAEPDGTVPLRPREMDVASQTVLVPAHRPVTVNVYICDVPSPASYAGTFRFFQEGASTTIDKSVSFSTRWPLWVAALFVFLGVGAGALIQRWRDQRESVVILQRDVARVRDDLERRTTPFLAVVATTDGDRVVTHLRHELERAFDVTRPTLDDHQKLLEDVRRKLPMVERWLRAGAWLGSQGREVPPQLQKKSAEIRDWLAQDHPEDATVPPGVIESIDDIEAQLRGLDLYYRRVERLQRTVATWHAATPGSALAATRDEIEGLLRDAQSLLDGKALEAASVKLDEADGKLRGQLAAALRDLASVTPPGVDAQTWAGRAGALELAASQVADPQSSGEPGAQFNSALADALPTMLDGISSIVSGPTAARKIADSRSALEQGRIVEAKRLYDQAATLAPAAQAAGISGEELHAVPTMGTPELSGRALAAVAPTAALQRRIDLASWFIALVAVVAGVLSGVALLYLPSATWGGFLDASAAVLWGLGIQVGTTAGFAGLSSTVKTLRGDPA